MDNIGWYIFHFFLSRTILVGISTGFVCLKMVGLSTSFVRHDQQWLVCLPVLSVMNNTGWYITGFGLSWTILVGTSPSFFLSWTILVGKSTIFSVMDNIGLYINRVFCVVDNNG